MLRPRFSPSLTLALSIALGACGPAPAPVVPAPTAAATITAKAPPAAQGDLDLDSLAYARIDTDVHYLAGPALAGRGTGDPGARLAVEYIRNRFQSLGLRPTGDIVGENPKTFVQTYFQRFEAKVGAKADAPALVFGKAGSKPAGGKRVVADGSASGTAEGAAVFVGYGITAPAAAWDDYAGKDIEGKIAVILAGAPRASKTVDKLKALRDFGSARYKIRTAREHKAAGVILVEGGDALPAAPQDPSSMGLPAIVISRATAKEKWTSVDFKTDKVWDAEAPAKPRDLGKSLVSITTKIDPVTADAWNVLGALPARKDSKLASEWIVVGAHYDHLGLGNQYSRAPGKREPHFGADDNASGTAMMLEVARRLAQLPERPLRNVLFAAWGAEEIGLVGSRWFIDHPTVPLANVNAMINADMVGRLRERQLLVDGAATAEGWSGLVKRAAEGLRLQVTFGAEGYGASDHASFTSAKIPVAFLFTGVHDDYHMPSDTADKLNIEGISTISVLAARLARSVADQDARMAFVEPPSDPHRMGRGGFKVSLGTLPDYAYQGKGLRLTGVRPDSPAARAGLGAGDVIVKVDKHVITNIHDYMFALGELEPGREATVEVEREGKGVSLKVVPAPGQGAEPHPREKQAPSGTPAQSPHQHP